MYCLELGHNTYTSHQGANPIGMYNWEVGVDEELRLSLRQIQQFFSHF
jgi:hypothetical protein